MKISKVEVKNFKSIKDYSIETTDFNVFVGQNNNGKTNLFDALDWFNSGKSSQDLYYKHDMSQVISVNVTYSGVQESLNELQNEAYAEAIRKVVGEHDNIVVVKTSADDKRSIFVDGEDKGNPRGFDATLNYFLPKIEYVSTKMQPSEVSGYKSKGPIAEMLSGVLTDVVENDPNYAEFSRIFNLLFNESGSVFRVAVKDLERRVETYLHKQFSEDTKVAFKIGDPKLEDMLKNFESEVDDGIKTKIQAKGDGMQRAVMLAIIQSYADYRKENGIARNFVFLIDEAELHLHPSAQRSLKQALKDIVSNGGQVFVNTHSAIFANEAEENQKMYSVVKKFGASNATEITGEQERMDAIYQLLGGSPSDILLPRNFIIVEGQTEYDFLSIIISRFYAVEARGIKILFARGDHEMEKEIYHAIHRAYTPLHTTGVYKANTILLLDHPHISKETDFNNFKTAHPWLVEGDQLHILSENAIEKYYPGEHKLNETSLGALEDKRTYAVTVANAVTRDQFESEMPTVHLALVKSIEKAHG